MLAPKTATAIAEYFRKQGKSVLLLVDSLTRTARAIREVSLALGEIPVRQGYTPSVYTELPRLLERSGNNDKGSITAVYTVLKNDDEESDPLAEEIKSLLDGHLVMRASVAQKGVRPAIDAVDSISRLFPRLNDSGIQNARARIVSMLARLKKDRDLVLLGGTPDEELSLAMKMENEIVEFLNQDIAEHCSLGRTREALIRIAQPVVK